MERLMRNVVRGGVMVLCAVGLTGCFSSYSWHQKMTVKVEADGQLYADFSVVEVSTTRHSDWLPAEGSYDSEMWGEAVVLELPEKRYLFALIKDAISLAPKVFEAQMDEALSESSARWAKILEDLRKTQDIVPKDYPLLVTFTDITDPKTVKQVDPENLAATFGPGVSLKRITLEITDEPVTEGKIDPVLKWLETVGDGMLDGRSISTIRAENRLANDLSRLDFKKGN